jgi:pyrophosphate--fructose-6-phosphate 1-phosphotransferase
MPKQLATGEIAVQKGRFVEPPGNDFEIKRIFPNTYGLPLVHIVSGAGELESSPITVGVVLSGGPAPGGHNAIAGLYDALKAANPASRLLGFLGGPKGVITNKHVELTAEFVDRFRNTGGFDMIGSGRDKIETPEQLKGCEETAIKLGLKALVVIGGDDSNTNAAILAEHCLAHKVPLQVIGLPKTIDGDMRNQFIEASFGFDTAAKTYAQLVGNVCRDSLSAKKYYHFIKLMGRSASHIALEVALQVHPNLAIISEEVKAKKMTLNNVVDQIVDVIVKRASTNKNYGVILIPEGLLEFLADFKEFLKELGSTLKSEEKQLQKLSTVEKRQLVAQRMTTGALYASLPPSIQEVLLIRDSHGNLTVSQIDTESFLVELVSRRLDDLKKAGTFTGKFAALTHFFGYEGRCVFPSNFDADYTYCLGRAAAQLIRAGLTGYTVSARNLAKPAEDWEFGGVPVTSMLTLEQRKGAMKPVIEKALVDLEGAPFKHFESKRGMWVVEDAFASPGPVQYFGPPELADMRSQTLLLESAAR